MAKEKSRTRKMAEKVVFAAFNVLKKNGGSMRGAEVVETLRTKLTFDEWEAHQYGKTGYIRWESILHFFTIDCIKAGYMTKNKGTWSLTPEGEEAIKLGADGLLNAANAAYRKWKNNQPNLSSTDIPKEDLLIEDIEGTFEQQQKAFLEQNEEKAYEGLRNFVLSKNPYEFQDMVAALLAAMGYHISSFAGKGRDGGIDIIAYTDPLGTKTPRIIVQVKHRPDSKIPSDDIQKLVGTMKRNSDVGIFVTSGEFSNPAKSEAKLSGQHVELIDFDRFIELWIEYYNKMKDVQKNMLPLYPVYFLGVNE